MFSGNFHYVAGDTNRVQVTPVEAYAGDPYGGLFGMAALIDASRLTRAPACSV